jgi:uncharacterized protein YjbI with pentapeptide repeats
MASPDHLHILARGVAVWNDWRDNDHTKPNLSQAYLRGAELRGANLKDVDLTAADLRGANLRDADLQGADLSEAILKGANLREAFLLESYLVAANLSEATLHQARLTRANLRLASLCKADLGWAWLDDADVRGANLSEANLHEAKLWRTMLLGASLRNARLTMSDLSGAHLEDADLSGATLYKANLGGATLTEVNLTQADLRQANLSEAELSGADLTGANLESAILVRTKCNAGTALTGCRIYGVSAWDVHLGGAKQENLIVTPSGEPEISVDNLEIAQLIYLLLNNNRIRDVIDTIGKKGILILGRFTRERKEVLDALRTALRRRGFVPMVFDFEKPTQRDFTETIMTLAGLSLFVIADITNPRSAPLELQAVVPDYMIPFVPIIAEGEQPFAMFSDLQQKFDWVLDVLVYDSIERLLATLDAAVIGPAVEKHELLVQRRAQSFGARHVREYLRR